MKARALVVGLAFAAGIAVSVCCAAAADLPPTPAPVAPVVYAPPEQFSWTGFYLGGHIGASSARPRESGDPAELYREIDMPFWVPAFAGMSGNCVNSIML